MLARRILLTLFVFKGVTMLLSCYRHCKEVQFSQNNEDALLLAHVAEPNDGSGDGTGSDSRHHHHVIPGVLVFTHYLNLLKPIMGDGRRHSRDDTNATHQELLALQQNVRDVIAMHPNATIRFLTDQDCITSIRNVLGADTRLVGYFQKESRGMYKSDICRGAALWETGGLYFDVDLGVRMSVWKLFGERTRFVTSLVHEKSKQRPGFFQAFIGATRQHPILRRYLELFIKYYDGELKLETPLLKEHKQMLGVRILHIAYSQIIQEEKDEEEDEVMKEDAIVKATTISRSLRSSSSSSSNSNFTIGPVELWQEFYYSKEKFPYIPEPTWGSEKSCKYVVVANKGRWPPAVPFYSRIAGSRMCPVR